MRLFIAIRPPQVAVDHLRTALEDVRGGAGRILRWSEPEQWHLTLAFHPQVPAGALEEILEDAAGIAADHAPFALELAGAGEFSGRTLWIGAGGDRRALGALLAAELLPGDPERGRRRAHLTVARVSSRAPELRRARRRRGGDREADPAGMLLGDAVRALAVYRGPAWEVTELEVLSSRLGEGRSGAPAHEVLARVPLGR